MVLKEKTQEGQPFNHKDTWGVGRTQLQPYPL